MMNSVFKKMKPGWATFLFSFVFLFFMACEEDIESNVNFDEDETSAYEAEESVETLFDVIESITNSAIQYSEANSGGRIAVGDYPELACAEVGFTGTRESGRFASGCGAGKSWSLREGFPHSFHCCK